MQDTAEAILGFLWVNSYNFASFRHPTTPDISSIPGSTIHEVTPAAIITIHRTAFDMGMALIGGNYYRDPQGFFSIRNDSRYWHGIHR